MTFVTSLLDANVTSRLSPLTSAANLPSGTTRPYYRDDGSPLRHMDAWLDISDTENPVVRVFYAPASYDDSYDDSFQN